MPHANITVNSGLFNGNPTIAFNSGEEIFVGSSGTFDASGGMLWNLANVSGSPVSLLDFTSSGAFIPPATLESLLTPASQARYTLSDVNNVIEATALTNYTWNVDANGNWSTASNWTSSQVPNSAGLPANFGTVITAPRVVTLDVPITVGALTFNNANQYTISGGSAGNTLTLDNAGDTASIQVSNGSHLISAPVQLNSPLNVNVVPSSGTLTISGNMSELNPGTTLNMSGAGTLLLTGTNSFTGAVSVNSGVLIVGGGNALAPTIGVTVADGAAFGLQNPTDNQTIGSLTVEGTNGVINLNSGTLNVASQGTGNIYGLTGSGALNVTASSSNATTTLAANDNFAGNMTINGGNIIVASAGALGVAGGTVTLNGVTWGNSIQFPGPVANQNLTIHVASGTTHVETGGYNIFNGNIAVDAGATFLYDEGGGNPGVINGVISGGGNFTDDGGPAGFFEFYRALQLEGALPNTLTGTTTVEQGTMELQKPDGVYSIAGPLVIGGFGQPAHVILEANEQIAPSVTVSIGYQSDLRLNGFTETIGGLSSATGYGAVGNYGTNPSTLILAGGGFSLFGGSLVDGGTASLALVMSGTGVQVLGSSSSYSGGTSIEAGTLELGDPQALGTGGLAANGGTLDLNGNGIMVSSFSGAAGTVTSSMTGGTLTVTQSIATTFGGTISDGFGQMALSLGGGTLTLSGTNTYTGGTTVSGGELIVDSPAALADGSNLTVGNAGAFAPVIGSASVAAVPEPSALALLATGGAAALIYRWRRRRGAKN